MANSILSGKRKRRHRGILALAGFSEAIIRTIAARLDTGLIPGGFLVMCAGTCHDGVPLIISA
ncbi:MAG: hypothetical protein SFX18_11590 [Pirellulales bacterium]|nr:hypothetical protein [Pirellulales bacterium]